MGNNPLFGCLLLLAAVGIAAIYMYMRREKEYQKGMEQYRLDMAAYEAAMQAQSAAPSAAAPAVTAVATGASAEGEVLLTGVEDATAALVIAILCEELGKNPAALQVRAITAL